MSHENQSKMLKPVYFKNCDFQTGNGNKLTDFALLGAVTKCIGNNIKCIQLDRELWRWVDTRVDVIQSIVDAKVKQVKEFRDKLLTVKKGVTFVESTYDNFWGSGLNESGTKHTKPASWPGMNMFGKVLTKTADKLKRPGSVSVTGSVCTCVSNLFAFTCIYKFYNKFSIKLTKKSATESGLNMASIRNELTRKS
ncbi:hypothetical protein KUTeg_019682 [Tegillarca granosa]|uniref:NADAR domain-containing protein n=1 Tax=Tegillarca granosa TaxID=220873 RepID=A0ABQ9EFT1_TEGGR|nr:hypothetical protein KUTeg_019682 [Tegillarca granosa]